MRALFTELADMYDRSQMFSMLANIEVCLGGIVYAMTASYRAAHLALHRGVEDCTGSRRGLSEYHICIQRAGAQGGRGRSANVSN